MKKLENIYAEALDLEGNLDRGKLIQDLNAEMAAVNVQIPGDKYILKQFAALYKAVEAAVGLIGQIIGYPDVEELVTNHRLDAEAYKAMEIYKLVFELDQPQSKLLVARAGVVEP